MQKGFYGILAVLAIGVLCPMFIQGCDDDDNDGSPSGAGNGDTNATYSQVDRMGIPTVNTVFNHPASVSGFSKTKYNQAGPENDVASYKSQFETVLGAVQNEDPVAASEFLLPDELPVKPATESDFSQLNGRRLQDDAVDIALFLVIGDSLASLHSDNVDSNDTPFRQDFPYLADPH